MCSRPGCSRGAYSQDPAGVRVLAYFMAASQSLGCRSHLDLHPSAVRHSGVPGAQCHHIVLCSSPLHPFAFHTSFLLFSGPPECSLCHAPTWVPVTTLKDLRFKLWQASLQKLPWLKSGCEQQEMGQGGRISLVAKARAHGEACKVGAGGGGLDHLPRLPDAMARKASIRI